MSVMSALAGVYSGLVLRDGTSIVFAVVSAIFGVFGYLTNRGALEEPTRQQVIGFLMKYLQKGELTTHELAKFAFLEMGDTHKGLIIPTLYDLERDGIVYRRSVDKDGRRINYYGLMR
jgi:hypothetical protein